jgi:hypothetical protein
MDIEWLEVRNYFEHKKISVARGDLNCHAGGCNATYICQVFMITPWVTDAYY